MKKIETKIIFNVIKKLLARANTNLPKSSYLKILNTFSNGNKCDKEFLDFFLQNASIANKTSRPLCQDTGQVIVFIKIGKDIFLEGEFLNDIINKAVEESYTENFYRKSVVKDALFDRSNTENNCPAIIYTEITNNSDEICIDLLVKGGGAENMSQLLMLPPTTSEETIIEEISNIVIQSGMKACPPLFLGIGIGGTAEKALLLSKKAFFEGNKKQFETNFAEKITKLTNEKNNLCPFSKMLIETKVISCPTHIACLPVGITFNCHSLRHSSCIIKDNDNIEYLNEIYSPIETSNFELKFKRIHTSEIDKLKKVYKNENILLSGTIYTARDVAHQRFIEDSTNNIPLPIDLKDSIIFYAGPCPAAPYEIIGPIGPTTSARMDRFSSFMSQKNVLALIGKGERSFESKQILLDGNVKYFTTYGGVACLLASCVKSCECVGYPELGPEAIYKLEVKDFPIICNF